MNNTAIVSKITEKKIFLVHVKDYGKKELTERTFWRVKVQDFQASNPKDIELKVNDAVEYYIPEKETIFASFLILVLPIILFLLCFFLLSLIGIDSDKLKTLISLLVLFLSFFTNNFLKKLGLKETLPTITKKIDKEVLKDMKTKCSDCGSCSACN